MSTTTPKKQLSLGLVPWLLAAGLFGVGLIGLVQRLLTGHQLVDYGSYVPWGIWVSVYVYLVWLEVGSLLVYSTIVYLFNWNHSLSSIKAQVYLAALTTLTPALLLIALDLGHPLRFWKTIVNPNFGSLMTWMVWLHLTYLAILLVKLYFVLKARQSGGTQYKSLLKVLALVSLPVGLALIGTVGGIFGVVAARPLWQQSVLPLYFFISALVAGSALVTLLYVLFGPVKERAEYRATARKLGMLTLGLLLFGAVAAAMNGLVTFYAGGPARVEAARLALFGPFWWSFWLVHLGLGVALPVVLLYLRPNAPRTVGFAAGLVVLTFVAVPLNVIIPAQLTESLENLGEAFSGPGLELSYFPTIEEWLVTAFALGLGLGLFLLAQHMLLTPRATTTEA
ncbi:MAG: NrfD/PsrC family molybdoenzyme membrane anchor subunit [Anaerolineae bacterium]|nr:NrfD/PsrC family molybdoenzyme membrane anchor subunit [Anaerolineae bacterium]